MSYPTPASAEQQQGTDRCAHDGGRSEAAFFMRPLLARQMEAACLAGELLPQKSTYFFPKLQTGLVFHLLDPDA